jgi:hypothetical protein
MHSQFLRATHVRHGMVGRLRSSGLTALPNLTYLSEQCDMMARGGALGRSPL